MIDIHLTKIISRSYPQSTSKDMSGVERREILDLMERGTSKESAENDISFDANFQPGRFVLTMKTRIVLRKARNALLLVYIEIK